MHDDATELLGINTRVELAIVDRILRERKTNELKLNGVTIVRPETVTIDMEVTIGADSVVESFAQIVGRTTVEKAAGSALGLLFVTHDSHRMLKLLHILNKQFNRR